MSRLLLLSNLTELNTNNNCGENVCTSYNGFVVSENNTTVEVEGNTFSIKDSFRSFLS